MSADKLSQRLQADPKFRAAEWDWLTTEVEEMEERMDRYAKRLELVEGALQALAYGVNDYALNHAIPTESASILRARMDRAFAALSPAAEASSQTADYPEPSCSAAYGRMGCCFAPGHVGRHASASGFYWSEGEQPTSAGSSQPTRETGAAENPGDWDRDAEVIAGKAGTQCADHPIPLNGCAGCHLTAVYLLGSSRGRVAALCAEVERLKQERVAALARAEKAEKALAEVPTFIEGARLPGTSDSERHWNNALSDLSRRLSGRIERALFAQPKEGR